MSNRTIVLALALAALAACNSNKANNGGATSTAAPATGPTATGSPNCNGQSPVWALDEAHVYLLPGDNMYGRTKRGQYMCLSDALKQGYKHGRGPHHRHRHHHNGETTAPST